MDAREMAIRAHGTQLYGNEPYSVHLDEVAALCEPFGETAVMVAYLHDCLEDTQLSAAEIRSAFGELVERCCVLLTDAPGANRKARKAATYEILSRVSAESPEALALVVKAADRLANVRRCSAGNPGLAAMYRKEHPASWPPYCAPA